MLAPNQVRFLQEKIMELRQALFINTSETVLKLPVCVVHALHVDDVGQVWFLSTRPMQHINQFDYQVPGKLEFYRKGKNYYLHVWGQATLVTDPEEINNATGISEEIKQQAFSSKWILIRLNISQLYYYPYPEYEPAVKAPIKLPWRASGLMKTLQYIIKDIIPVFQSH